MAKGNTTRSSVQQARGRESAFKSERRPDTSYESAFWQRHMIVAGVDEAGRGALAGPVVAAAVVLPLQHQGMEAVRDSKEVPEAEREELYDVICKQAMTWSIGVVSAQRIDEINILQATFEAMEAAVRGLSPIPGHLLIDGNRFRGSAIPYTTIVGGDAISLSIAAASIIAKVTRDRLMREMHDSESAYDFKRNKGYGTAFHRDQLVLLGPGRYHRQTFLSKILSGQEQLFLES